MTQRQINNIADRAVKKDRYEARLMVEGKLPFPGTVRPKLRGWAAIVTLEGR